MLSQNTSLNKIFKEYNQSGSLSMIEQTQKKIEKLINVCILHVHSQITTGFQEKKIIKKIKNA